MKSYYRICIGALLCFLLPLLTYGERLKPGFDPDEYIDVLKRCALQVNMQLQLTHPRELAFKRVYSSPEMGFHNKWELWINKDSTIMAINLRGTTNSADSWLENFYSAMIPATGSLKLDGKTDFPYRFATNPRAGVHAGWAIGICSMLPDIMGRLIAWYRQGVNQVVIEGHSQGGALAFLLSAYLHCSQLDGKLPPSLTIKTYCSAAPKPGNLYFAYDFDFMNRGGWANCVVNSADWVPEMPFSVQTVNDVNLNPFGFTNKAMSKNLFVKLYVKHMFNSLDRHTRKAERKNDKFLGRVLYKVVKKYMKDMKQPQYIGSCNYARAGNPVILHADEEYYKKFPDTGSNIFRNHLFAPYYYLVERDYK